MKPWRTSSRQIAAVINDLPAWEVVPTTMIEFVIIGAGGLKPHRFKSPPNWVTYRILTWVL
jgi:hypothetical protein